MKRNKNKNKGRKKGKRGKEETCHREKKKTDVDVRNRKVITGTVNYALGEVYGMNPWFPQ